MILQFQSLGKATCGSVAMAEAMQLCYGAACHILGDAGRGRRPPPLYLPGTRGQSVSLPPLNRKVEIENLIGGKLRNLMLQNV